MTGVPIQGVPIQGVNFHVSLAPTVVGQFLSLADGLARGDTKSPTSYKVDSTSSNAQSASNSSTILIFGNNYWRSG